MASESGAYGASSPGRFRGVGFEAFDQALWKSKQRDNCFVLLRHGKHLKWGADGSIENQIRCYFEAEYPEKFCFVSVNYNDVPSRTWARRNLLVDADPLGDAGYYLFQRGRRGRFLPESSSYLSWAKPGFGPALRRYFAYLDDVWITTVADYVIDGVEGLLEGGAPSQAPPTKKPRPPGSDPWSILGVPYGTSLRACKLSYRKAARETHPDRVFGLSEELNEVAARQLRSLNQAIAEVERFHNTQSKSGPVA